MKISLNWLSDFIDLTETDPMEIARRITAGIAEVDVVEMQGSLLNKCCVGKVLRIEKHPNADRLSVCDVQTDNGVKKVVCGGTNLRTGMRVAFAHTGATVRWHGTDMVTLEKTKIRGVESEGMICAAEELDLASRFPSKPEDGERAIIDMGEGDEGVGQSLAEYLRLGDTVLHIDNHAITHRADLFSHYGFAREFVALGLATWKKTKVESGKKLKVESKKKTSTFNSQLSTFNFPKKDLPFQCLVDDKTLVPRYAACLLEIDNIGETPDWMKKKLEATGWRSINLPIDITNYVATELGMPLHSFDADDIQGDMHIRGAKQGEKIVTLDTVDRVLPEGAIVMNDDIGIFDLLGIMGGLRSSTKPSTKRIYLHAAIVNPVAIRKAIIGTGHRTDASTVYEKGIPPIMATKGLMRALELFLKLVPGARIVSKLEEWGDEGTATPIELSMEYVTRMLGIEISKEEVTEILESLEFDVQSGTKNQKSKIKNLDVTPPLHRLGDIKGSHDLVEEIGRIKGYDSITPVLPTASIEPPVREKRVHILRDALKEEGFTELVPLSLIGPSLLQKANIDPSIAPEIRNPLGEELSLMHPSALPSLLSHAERNISYAGKDIATFHVGKVFKKNAPERWELSVLLAPIHPASSSIQEEPLLRVKQSLRYLCGELGYDLACSELRDTPAYAHPGRAAEIFLKKKSEGDESSPEEVIGSLFELHPDVQARFSLPHRAAVALLDLSAVRALPTAVKVAKPVPLFPAVSYDATITLSHREQAANMLLQLEGSHPLLESVAVVDLYSGKPLKELEYNLTLRFTYRAADRTLTEDEAQKAQEEVLKGVQG